MHNWDLEIEVRGITSSTKVKFDDIDGVVAGSLKVVDKIQCLNLQISNSYIGLGFYLIT